MSQPSVLVNAIRARLEQLVTIERGLHAYLAALEAAQAADLAQIPPELRFRIDARAAAMQDVQRLLHQKADR
jgi:hypothetical protein